MKNLYFIFYQDNNYLSDRLLILYDRINPHGIWKFINIYKNDILLNLPIEIETIPAIYNVMDKELYIGEYVFEFMRSFDSVKYNRYLKIINERLEERDDNEIETIHKIPTTQRIETENNIFKPSIHRQENNIQKYKPSLHNNENISNVYEDEDVNLYESTVNYQMKNESNRQMENLNPYDNTQNSSLSFNDNYDNYSGIQNTEIIDSNERDYIHNINNQIKTDYESIKNERNTDLRNSHKSKKNINIYDI